MLCILKISHLLLPYSVPQTSRSDLPEFLTLHDTETNFWHIRTLRKMNTQLGSFTRCTAGIPVEVNAQKQVQWLVLQVVARGELVVDNTGLEHKDCGSD